MFLQFIFHLLVERLLSINWCRDLKIQTIKRKTEVWQPDERNKDLFEDNYFRKEISKEYDHKNVRLYICHTHLYGTRVP
jgi:hypothetical protein